MKKTAILLLFCFVSTLLINLANTQNTDKIQFRIAKPLFRMILPQTHAEVSFSQSFMDVWENVQSDTQNPKAITFLHKSTSSDKPKLKIFDYLENDPVKIVEETKESMISSNFAVESEKILTLDNKQIFSLFFQNSTQNVQAFYVFKIANFVFSVAIYSKYSAYASVDKYWYEILNKIKVSDKIKFGYDKISVAKSVSILVPSITKYNLPVRNSVFEGKLESLNFQCYVHHSKQSIRKIANDIEHRLIDRLGFKRVKGEIDAINEVETVDLYGIFSQSKNLNLYLRAFRDTCVIIVFEYENNLATQKIIAEIKQSVTFAQQNEYPDTFIPFAFMVDNDNDGLPDYFTINMVFFSKTKEILADALADSSISIKIYDQNNKLVYKSVLVKVFSPEDCLPGGECSEFFRFDGLWLAKIKDPDYRINVMAIFKNKKLEFNGNLTELLIR